MNAGEMRYSLTIQEPINTQNSYGETIQTWRDFATVNGGVKPSSAREFWRASQQVADATHGVTIRYLPGVLPTMRILYGARVLNIISVLDNEERHVELNLICKETVA